MRYLIILSFAISLNSCSKNLIPFSNQLIAENQFSENDIKSIQFYLSEDIILQRQLGKSESKIENGEIKLVEGKRVEEIILKKGTPGVFREKSNTGKYKIYFDSGESDYLTFGPNPKRKGNFVLLAKEWNKKIGVIHYGGKKYVTKTESSYSMLLVDYKKINKLEKRSRNAKGVLIE